FVERELATGGYIDKRDLDLVLITDDVERAVDEGTGFYANYHSQRFVDGRLVLRLRHAPDDATLEALNQECADTGGRGRIDRIDTPPPGWADGDRVDPERVASGSDPSGSARLRTLIDRLNGREHRS